MSNALYAISGVMSTTSRRKMINATRHSHRIRIFARGRFTPGSIAFRRTLPCLLLAGLTLLAPPTGRATDLKVSNMALESAADSSSAVFRFDIGWNHSWRRAWTDRTGNIENWDAAWVFVKIRTDRGDWRHALLGTTGAQIPGECAVQVADDGAGAFLYRSAAGAGPIEFRGVRLPWDLARQGLARADDVEVQVIGLEMVYVPQGQFFLGSGGTEGGCFHKAPSAPLPYRLQRPFEITGEGAFAMSEARGALTRSPHADSHGDHAGGRAGQIPAAFPKGFRAFYCMKHELSQGQYAAFLNLLTVNQASQRYNDPRGWGYTISGEYPAHEAGVSTRACNFINWPDAAAYADWAGLRPMTEFEFEKACRGTVLPVPNEYAWGNTRICSWRYEIADITSDTAIALNPATGRVGNAVYSSTAGWHFGSPMRCGLFRASITGQATREELGATYYGILDMSGNLCELTISAGHPVGREFSGLHGNGHLTDEGKADVQGWPGEDAAGSGFRDGSWSSGPRLIRISDRSLAAGAVTDRRWPGAWRGVRTAPEK